MTARSDRNRFRADGKAGRFALGRAASPTFSTSPIVLALFAGLASLSVVCGAKAESDSEREARLRAAFLYNFASYIDWPSEPPAVSTPFVIGVWQNDGSMKGLETELKGKLVKGRPIELLAVEKDSVAKAKDLRVLVIDSESAALFAKALAAVEKQPILVISRYKEHCGQGAMICFLTEDGRLRFTIDKTAAERANLKIGSQLLKLARPSP